MMGIFRTGIIELRRVCVIILTLTGFFCLFPFDLSANSGIGSGIYLSNTPLLVTVNSMGLAFVLIVFLEAIIFWRILKLTFLKALWVSFAANVISTILGFIATFFTSYPVSDSIGYFVVAIVLFTWLYIKWKTIPLAVSWTILLSVCVGFVFFLIVQFNVYNSYNFSSSRPYVLFFISALIPQYGASVFIEGLAVRWLLKKQDIWKAIVIANIISYIILVAGASHYFRPRDFDHSAWMGRAKGTLRSLGSSQLAYRDTNRNRVYGSFKALKDDLYIAEGYDLDNMIENYRMTWSVNNISTVPSEEFPKGIISTFTIVAYPRDTRPGYISTFAITDDRVVRVFNPDNKQNKFDAVRSWDPIL